MIALFVVNAFASEVTVGFPVGPDRYVSSVVTSDWASSVDTPLRKCWTRGPGELCLAVTDAGGKAPMALIDAEKTKYTVTSCETVWQPASTAAATAQCLVLEVINSVQEQNRYWSVVVDGPHAVWVTVRFAGDDDAAEAEAGAFVSKFVFASPIFLTTLGVPVCKAIHDTLTASVDRFASIRGGPGDPANKTTFAWPGALTNELVTTGDKVSYHATITMRADPNDALAQTKLLLDSFAPCDSWCAPMTSAETATPERREVALIPQPSPQSPRCAATPMRVVVSKNALDLFDVSVWVDAP